jgi:hypothetical protein
MKQTMIAMPGTNAEARSHNWSFFGFFSFFGQDPPG